MPALNTISEETRRTFSQVLEDYNESDLQKRQTAEIRLNQIPREQRTQLVGEAWECLKKDKRKTTRRLVLFVCVLFMSYLVMFLVSIYTKLSSAIFTGFPMMLLPIFTAGYSKIIKNGHGIAHVLLTLNDPALCPILIEVLADKGLNVQGQQTLGPALQQKLERLLPLYLLADLPPLSAEHQKYLLQRLQAFTELPDWEGGIRGGRAPLQISKEDVEHLVTLIQALQLVDKRNLQKQTRQVVCGLVGNVPRNAPEQSFITEAARQVLNRF